LKRCAQCILSEQCVDITFDDSGRCNYCCRLEKHTLLPALGEKAPIEIAMDNIFRDVKYGNRKVEWEEDDGSEYKRTAGKYDCISLFSGGKDSLMALWLVVRVYKLKVLAITLDNGFLSSEVVANARRTTQRLGVDWQVVAEKTPKAVYSSFLRSKYRKQVSVCVLCNRIRGMFYATTFRLIEEENIPVVVDGRSKLREPPGELWPGLAKQNQLAMEFITEYQRKNDLDTMYIDLPSTQWRGYWISPWMHLRRDLEESMEFLNKEIGWKPPRYGWPYGSSNCRLSLLDGYLCHLYSIPDDPYEHEMSMEIRGGEISRERTLSNFEHPVDETTLREVLGEFDLSIGDL